MGGPTFGGGGGPYRWDTTFPKTIIPWERGPSEPPSNGQVTNPPLPPDVLTRGRPMLPPFVGPGGEITTIDPTELRGYPLPVEPWYWFLPFPYVGRRRKIREGEVVPFGGR